MFNTPPLPQHRKNTPKKIPEIRHNNNNNNNNIVTTMLIHLWTVWRWFLARPRGGCGVKARFLPDTFESLFVMPDCWTNAGAPLVTWRWCGGALGDAHVVSCPGLLGQYPEDRSIGSPKKEDSNAKLLLAIVVHCVVSNSLFGPAHFRQSMGQWLPTLPTCLRGNLGKLKKD
eukprot:4698676-Amphidinium_carterae.1